jgi:peptidoglycan/xylan/chitin deacetylase (PgdA/CDA1 family)
MLSSVYHCFSKITGVYYVLPTYHVVSDRPVPHLSALYKRKSLKNFEKEVDYVARHFKIVDARELLKSCRENYKGKPLAHFSFDDGLRETFATAVPLLKRKGIPATFFINSALIGNRKLMYRFKASLISEHLKSVSDQKLSDYELILQKVEGSDFFQKLLKINLKQENLLDEVAAGAGLSFDDYLAEHKPYLESDELDILKKDGFTIGSHAHDHPLFSALLPGEQLLEIQTSMQKLARWIDPDLKLFAFPFTDYGVKRSFFEEAHKLQLFDMSFGTAGLHSDVVPYHLQRIPMEEPYNKFGTQVFNYQYTKAIVNKLRGRIKIDR